MSLYLDGLLNTRTFVDYGSVRVGSSDPDITDELQAAVDRADRAVFLPAGDFSISRTVEVSNKFSLTVLGFGPQRTRLYWEGDADGPALRVGSSQYCVFEDFSLRTDGYPIDTMVSVEATHPVVNSAHTWNRIQVWGDEAGNLSKGLRFMPTESFEGNNEMNQFNRCQFWRYADRGWSIEHNQSTHHQFNQCSVAGSMVGPGSVGVWSFSPAFLWYGGSGYGNSEADFRIGFNATAAVQIDGMISESSGSLLKSPQKAYTPSHVTVRNTTFNSTFLKSDNRIVDYGGHGNLLLENCRLGRTEIPGEIWIADHSPSSQSSQVIGGGVWSSLSDPFAAAEPTFRRGFWHNDGISNVLMPDLG